MTLTWPAMAKPAAISPIPTMAEMKRVRSLTSVRPPSTPHALRHTRPWRTVKCEGVPGAIKPRGHGRTPPSFSVVRGGPSGSPERRLYHRDSGQCSVDSGQAQDKVPESNLRSLTADH